MNNVNAALMNVNVQPGTNCLHVSQPHCGKELLSNGTDVESQTDCIDQTSYRR
jgi:hypothetical protein